MNLMLPMTCGKDSEHIGGKVLKNDPSFIDTQMKQLEGFLCHRIAFD